jgi:hypothetical protein
MAETVTIQIQLTREQELQIAAATGLLVGTLEVDLAGLGEGESAAAQIPEAVVDASLSAAPPPVVEDPPRSNDGSCGGTLPDLDLMAPQADRLSSRARSTRAG